MSKLEALVPPPELCKKIPAGAFEDSAFVYIKKNRFGDIVIAERRSIVSTVLKAKILYPAPMLQEIMEDISFHGGNSRSNLSRLCAALNSSHQTISTSTCAKGITPRNLHCNSGWNSRRKKMLRLENFVPSLNACLRIPKGKFADSILVWGKDQEGLIRVIPRCIADAEHILAPAPTTGEIVYGEGPDGVVHDALELWLKLEAAHE